MYTAMKKRTSRVPFEPEDQQSSWNRFTKEEMLGYLAKVELEYDEEK